MDDSSSNIRVIIPPRPPNGEASSGRHIKRALTVSEALQFSPLTMSVLPAHDRIPLPQISRSREEARLTLASERKAVQQVLAQYPITKVQEKMKVLLDHDSLAEINFKQVPMLSMNTQPPRKQIDYSLSSVAKTVLDMSQIDYGLSMKNTPIKSEQSILPQPTKKTPSKPLVPQVVIPPRATVMQASPQQPHQPGTISETFPVNKSLNQQSVVVKISHPSPEFKREDYGTVSIKSPVQRVSQLEQITPTSIPNRIQSQRSADDAVVQRFQDFLMGIFEVQDQIDAGATDDSGIFQADEDASDMEPSLTDRTLEKLATDLKKLVSLKRLVDLSAEHIRRLQRLCEPAIERAQFLSLQVQSDDSDEAHAEWRQKAHAIENVMLSASVCMYTVIGCPHEETLTASESCIWIPNVLVNLFENCLIPVVESRADAQEDGIFSTAILHKDVLKRLLDSGRKLLELMTTACADVKSTSNSINPIEFLSSKLLFVQNASTDKNSCLGVQVFEKARKAAMSCLARIYARFSNERTAILDEILTSLDRLPSNSRSARQYRLGDGKSIQLITALFMQLVQTTSLEVQDKDKQHDLGTNGTKKISHHDSDEDEENEDYDSDMQVEGDRTSNKVEGPMRRLNAKACKLFDSSAKGAHDIITYLVNRASKTTKSGDSPYRNIFDLFVEDLVTLLPFPDWPASELMLRLLAKKMTDLASNDKSAATKNMALESLGTMGSVISNLKAGLSGQCAVLEREGRVQSDTSRLLCDLVRDYETNRLQIEALIAIDGPFALISRQLLSDAGSGLRARGACGYFIAHFAKLVSRRSSGEVVDETDIESPRVRTANWLLDLIPQVGLDAIAMHHLESITDEEGELAYSLCILNVGFCTWFPTIVKTLAASFSSDQALVRSRSLRSVVAMLEIDSSLLDHDHTIAEDVFRCASDDSAMVRDSALSLIAKFIIAKPGLEQKGIKRLLECAKDSKVGVQKRAIGHLKEVYMKDSRHLLKAKIASTFLEQTAHFEDVVADLAKKTLTEVWITPTLASLSNPAEAKQKVAVQNLTKDIANSIIHDPVDLAVLLQKFLAASLKGDAKIVAQIRHLYTRLVDELFEQTISGAEDQGPLHALTAFAAADSLLIPAERLAKLQSYLGNIQNESDLFVFRSVLKIYQCVLPDLSVMHKPLLADIQVSLMKIIPALGRRAELDAVMSCLSTIDGVLKNTLKLARFAASIFSGVQRSGQEAPKLVRFLRMAGPIARHLDIEAHANDFSAIVKGVKGSSVAEKMGEVFYSLTSESQSREIRALATEGLGSVCQASPALFTRKHYWATFASVFAERRDSVTEEDYQYMQLVVLRIFDELYGLRAQAKAESEEELEVKEQQELGKLGGDSKTRQSNSAVVTITPHAVDAVLKIALSVEGDRAWLATRTLANISHEGLIHPKQSTSAFVALSTSPDERIAAIACQAHSLLHQTHESVTEREYLYAIPAAFEYQDKVVQSPTGALAVEYKPKLAKCFSIISTSGSKYVKKFLSSMINRVAADAAVHSKSGQSTDQVLYARFVMQNIAYFEYSKQDELLHLILQLELAYSKTGGEVAQILESTLSRPLPPEVPSETALVNGDVAADYNNSDFATPIDTETVRKLAPTAAALSLIIETRSYLKRQYGIIQDVRAIIANNKQAKDSGKSPTRIHGINGERIWYRTNSIVASLATWEGMLECCRSFVSLMSAEEEVAGEGDAGFDDANGNTPFGEANGYSHGGTPAAKKRKGSASASGTPVKKQRSRPKKERTRSTSASSDDDDLDPDFE